MASNKGANTLTDAAISDLKRIRRRVLGVGKGSGGFGGEAHVRNATWYWAKTSSSVTAGSLEVPTTFTFNIWVPDPDSEVDPVPFIVSPDSDLLSVTGVNRSAGTLASGAMIKVEFAYNEWTPKWIEC